MQSQNRRKKRRHLDGETGGDLAQHWGLRRDRSDGYRAHAYAHSRALSLPESQNQLLLHLYAYGFRRVVSFHRRAADSRGGRGAEGVYYGGIGDGVLPTSAVGAGFK